jgi:hypothetical protein
VTLLAIALLRAFPKGLRPAKFCRNRVLEHPQHISFDPYRARRQTDQAFPEPVDGVGLLEVSSSAESLKSRF